MEKHLLLPEKLVAICKSKSYRFLLLIILLLTVCLDGQAVITIVKSQGNKISITDSELLIDNELVIQGDLLENEDWKVLRELSNEYHLTLRTLNQEIPVDAFKDCVALKTADFPNITTISGGAFYNCSGLTDVSFPNVITIDGSAFYNCSGLTTVSFPKTTSIGWGAFLRCSGLTSIDFPNANTVVEFAFRECNELTQVDLPQAISLGQEAFRKCEKLTSVSFPEATSVGVDVFYECPVLASVSLPKVESIGPFAFRGCSDLTSIDLPQATSIGNQAFRDCTGLTSVSIPQVTSIGDYAFWKCENLTSIDCAEALSIGNQAFRDCSVLSSASFPKATSIGQFAFRDCAALTSISIPQAATIGNYAFRDCSQLKVVVLPDSPASIGTSAFNGVSALLLIVPEATNYTQAVLDQYPAGSEAFNETLKTRITTIPQGSSIMLTPDHIPQIGMNAGGLFRWEKDGFIKNGADEETYTTSEGGHYILYYILEGHEIELCNILLNIEFPDPDPVFYGITLPVVENAQISVSGISYVEEGEDFAFTITPQGENKEKKLQVSTSRLLPPDNEGVIVTDNQDGSFLVTIRNINENMTVYIEFTGEIPTGIIPIENKNYIWTGNSGLYICPAQHVTASVYTISGSLVKTTRMNTGETNHIPLNRGAYIVVLNDQTYKIVIH